MASFINNISIKNKIVFSLILTLFISIGIAVVEFNQIVKIEHNQKKNSLLEIYQAYFNELDQHYYELEVIISGITNAQTQDEYIIFVNDFNNLDKEISSVLKEMKAINLADVKDEELLLMASRYADSITNYTAIYNKNIFTTISQLINYKNFTLNPGKIEQNYKRLLAEQQKLGNILPEYSQMNYTKDEILMELMRVYNVSIVNLKTYLTGIINEQHISLNNINLDIENIIRNNNTTSVQIRKRIVLISISLFIASILFIVLLTYIIVNNITRPLEETNDLIEKLAVGNFVDSLKIERADEIGLILNSINKLLEHLRSTVEFSQEISKGNFEYDYKPAGENDLLGNSLLQLRENLLQAKREEDKRRVDDYRRTRATEGVSKFADILRQNQNDLKKLGSEVISNLVKFLDANQGVMFILNDDDKNNPYLKLVSAYAWNREKFLQKNIPVGEGLIGSVAEEKFTVYMTDVPEDYIEIKSGTGSANPTSILIVPLKVDEEVLGVIELASFKEFEKYEIEIVENIAENIASTLKSVRISVQTAELLEKFQIQAAEMKEQEESLKATIAELQKLQEAEKSNREELSAKLKEITDLNKQIQYKDEQLKKEIEKLRKENEEHLSKIKQQNTAMLELINKMFISVVIIKQGGEIEFANTAVEKYLGYSEIELTGTNIERIIEKPPTAVNQALCEYLYENIDFINQEGGKEFYVKDKQGNLKKVILEISLIGQDEQRRLVIFFKDLQFLEAKEKETDAFVDELFEIDFENILKIEFYEDYLAQQGLEVPKFVLDENEIIKWGPKFQLGVKMIDSQHKKWIEFINKFYSALIKKKDAKELNETLKKLSEYTEYHFSFEEKYMEEFGYKDFDNHHKEHEQFVIQLNQYFDDYISGKIGTIHRIILYLKKWVVKHVLETDRKYVDLFKKHGLR